MAIFPSSHLLYTALLSPKCYWYEGLCENVGIKKVLFDSEITRSRCTTSWGGKAVVEISSLKAFPLTLVVVDRPFISFCTATSIPPRLTIRNNTTLHFTV